MRNLSRLMLDRLQAESATCMYSEHELEPLMRAVFEQVCQSLIVVSNCMPGSPHSHAAWEIARSTSVALTTSMISPVVTPRSSQGPLLMAARMKSSVARTELL